MGKDVFISYKAEEFRQADQVRTALECRGIRCWMAPDSIPGGTSYATEIPKAIRECPVFVLILSAKAMESMWVPKEVDQAINCKKTILPFMIENCALTDAFRFYLSDVQCYMAFQDKNEALDKLVERIHSILGTPNRGNTQPPEPSQYTPPTPPKQKAAKRAEPPKAGAKPKVNRLVIAAFVCGLLGWGSAFIVIPELVFAPATLILAICGRAAIRKTGQRGAGLAVASLVLGCLLLVAAVAVVVPSLAMVFIWLALVILCVFLYRKSAGKTGKKR